MDNKLLEEIKEYIELWEVEKAEEWGSCESLEELIKTNKMPKIYDKICSLITTNRI